MRLRAIIREARRNVASGTSRAATFALLLALVVAGVSAFELATVRGVISEAEHFRNAGGSTLILTAPSRIDGVACDAFRTVSGVRAAGALKESDERIVASALPSTSIPTFHVTGGVPALLGTDTPRSAGLVISTDVANSLALTPGDSLTTTAGPAPIAAVFAYPEDGRRPGLGYAALLPIPAVAERFDECWLDAWPPLSDATTLLQTAVLPGTEEDGAPQLSQLNTALGTTFDGAGKFDARLTHWGFVAAGFLSFGLGWLAVRVRRLEFSSALHADMSRRTLLAIIGLEALVWVSTASALWLGTVLVGAAGAPAVDRSALILLGARIWIAGLAGTAAGIGAGIARTRERDLFRAFRER